MYRISAINMSFSFPKRAVLELHYIAQKNFTKFPRVKVFWNRTVSAKFRDKLSKTLGKLRSSTKFLHQQIRR